MVILSSRPSSPAALLLLTGPQPAGVWNDRPYPAWNGLSPLDELAIWTIVKDAFRSWQIDVTTDAAIAKPHGTVAFNSLFGNYPISGGQANAGSFNQPGIGAFVFGDQLGWNPRLIGRDAVHEAGHVLASLPHVWDAATGYVPGFWMGNPFIGDPQWTPDHRQTLDAAFGPCADLDFNGHVDMADVQLLRDGGYSAVEAINLGRNFGK